MKKTKILVTLKSKPTKDEEGKIDAKIKPTKDV
jgi:hypothetical protein